MRLLIPPSNTIHAPLADSAKAVFLALAAAGPMTRPQLGATLALSKPTMSAAVAELTAQRLVTSHGVSQGATGRKAVLYGLAPGAGHVLGIDAGSTHVRAVAHSLDGRGLAEAEIRLVQRQRHVSSEMSEAVRSAAATLGRKARSRFGPLRAIAVALPSIVSATRPELTHHGDIDTLLERFDPPPDVPLILENNVNAAAIGELRHGAARGRNSFAYLQVGVKIGLGIVVGGRLFHGFNGAAGEVSRLPFPWSETEASRREGLEEYLGSDALVQRSIRDWPKADGDRPKSAQDLFQRAVEGSAHARGWVERHAADIGRLVAACVGILDPGLVVLGGGVGQNALMVEGVRRMVTELTWPTEIATSLLGPRGTMLGAVQIAADYAIDLIVGRDRPAAALTRPGPILRDEASDAQSRDPRLLVQGA